jgi:hypothetical protein
MLYVCCRGNVHFPRYFRDRAEKPLYFVSVDRQRQLLNPTEFSYDLEINRRNLSMYTSSDYNELREDLFFLYELFQVTFDYQLHTRWIMGMIHPRNVSHIVDSKTTVYMDKRNCQKTWKWVRNPLDLDSSRFNFMIDAIWISSFFRGVCWKHVRCMEKPILSCWI